MNYEGIRDYVSRIQKLQEFLENFIDFGTFCFLEKVQIDKSIRLYRAGCVSEFG